MNEFFKTILFHDMCEKKALSPFIKSCSIEHNIEPCDIRYKIKHILEFKFGMDFWLDVHGTQYQKDEILKIFLNQMHRQLFGNIECLLHELDMHLHREDFDSCKEVVKLILEEVKGD